MTPYDHLLGVDLGHQAGYPPQKPHVSAATREQVRADYVAAVCAEAGVSIDVPSYESPILVWPRTP